MATADAARRNENRKLWRLKMVMAKIMASEKPAGGMWPVNGCRRKSVKKVSKWRRSKAPAKAKAGEISKKAAP